MDTEGTYELFLDSGSLEFSPDSNINHHPGFEYSMNRFVCYTIGWLRCILDKAEGEAVDFPLSYAANLPLRTQEL